MVSVPTIIFKFKQNGELSVENLTEFFSIKKIIPKIVYNIQTDVFTVSLYLPSYMIDHLINIQLLEDVNNNSILFSCVESLIQI